MRNVHALVEDELEKKEFKPFYYIWINTGTDAEPVYWRYTDCDIKLVVDGETYSPRGFRINPINYGMGSIISKVKFEMENLDLIFTSLFVGSVVQGKEATIGFVVLDADNVGVGDPFTLFNGYIDDWSLDEEKVKITLASFLVKWSQKTVNRHAPSCRWKVFGDATTCKYSGSETWCDRTYTRCASLGNAANFGGFRWLSSMVDKEINWGKA